MVDILKLRKMSETPSKGSGKSDESDPSPVSKPEKPVEPVVSKPTEDSEKTFVDASTDTVRPILKKPAPVAEKVETTSQEEVKTVQESSPMVDEPDQDQKVIDLVVFTLAERLFGVDIIKVQEVVRYTEITRVPNAAEFVLGVMNLRGNITPVIDLHKRFSLAEASWTDKTRIIVLQIKDQAIGFLVDHVSEIMHPLESDIEPTSTVHANIGTDYISGVVKIRDSDENAKKLLILLNLERIFDEGAIALG